MRFYFNKWVCFCLFLTLCIILSSCGKPSDNNVPKINSFNATKTDSKDLFGITFNWSILDVDGNVLTCKLDVDNDNVFDYTINDCTDASSQNHSYDDYGTFTAKLVIEDGQGGNTSAIDEVIISPDSISPTVSLESSKTDVTSKTEIVLTAAAKDDVGIARVEFFKDGAIIGSVDAEPYKQVITLDATDNGTVEFIATAYDLAGNASDSDVVTVTVNIPGEPDTTAPTIELDSSSLNVGEAGELVLIASAEDNVGIAKVEFYQEGVKLAEASIAPYEHRINLTADDNGTLIFAAKAYDAAGNVGTSNPISINVDIPSFTLQWCDPGNEVDYNSSCGVKLVEQDGKDGYLAFEVMPDSELPQTTAYFSVESEAPSGITYHWASEEATIGNGSGIINTLRVDAASSAALGTYEVTVSVTVDAVTKRVTGNFIVTKGPTEVGGIIDTDTTWALENSPYQLTSDVQLAYGATLTIEAGVEVRGDSYKLQTWGELKAIGTMNNPIHFRNVHLAPGTNNSPQEPYLIHIEYAVIEGGGLLEPTGNATYGSVILRDSVLEELSAYTHLWYPVADSYFERNIFIKTGGLDIGARDVNVYVRNNVFYQQHGDTYGNQFAVRAWAAYGTAKIVVEHNSFLSTDRVAVEVQNDGAMSATNNFWNTTNTNVIENMIYDKNDDLSLPDYIEYEPFLTEPHPDTPDPSPYLPS